MVCNGAGITWGSLSAKVVSMKGKDIDKLKAKYRSQCDDSEIISKLAGDIRTVSGSALYVDSFTF